MAYRKTIYSTIVVIIILSEFISCKKFIEIDPPRTELVSTTVYLSDATAEAAVANLYRTLSRSNFFDGAGVSVSYAFGCASDELISQYYLYNFEEIAKMQTNEITAESSLMDLYWADGYSIIYNTNAIIEGLTNSSAISPVFKNRLEGEAKFIRAFVYFYLVNIWGDVPLATTTDYNSNSNIAKTGKELVYQQIIADLTDAKSLLPDNYFAENNERVRANKGAATALLSRVYLFRQDWEKAEMEASSVINQTELYALEPELNKMFNITSKEPIFQIWRSLTYTQESLLTLLNQFYLSPELVNVFENQDQRLINWAANTGTGYSVNKYKFMSPDYSTVIRLGEQYLIRAEARAMQNKLIGNNGAVSDIDSIRVRAGLLPSTATTKEELLSAVEQERRVELFSEWGHRWFDLIRTERATIVLSAIKPAWQDWKILMPIPQTQIDKDPAMADAQNPHY